MIQDKNNEEELEMMGVEKVDSAVISAQFTISVVEDLQFSTLNEYLEDLN